jgi:hypothetical protein
MMKATSVFWFLFILCAAYPLILVGLSALERRYPAGLPARRRWAFRAALVLVWLAVSVYHFIVGRTGWGFVYLALGITDVVNALLDHRRRASVARAVSEGAQRVVNNGDPSPSSPGGTSPAS